jgi:hypothetical protein
VNYYNIGKSSILKKSIDNSRIAFADRLFTFLIHHFKKKIFPVPGFQLHADRGSRPNHTGKTTAQSLEPPRIATGFPIYQFPGGQGAGALQNEFYRFLWK